MGLGAQAGKGQGGWLWGCPSHLRGAMEEATERPGLHFSSPLPLPDGTTFLRDPGSRSAKWGEGMALTAQGDGEAQIKPC